MMLSLLEFPLGGIAFSLLGFPVGFLIPPLLQDLRGCLHFSCRGCCRMGWDFQGGQIDQEWDSGRWCRQARVRGQ